MPPTPRRAGDFAAFPLGRGATLYARAIPKFKTTLFKVFLDAPLGDPKEATRLALATQCVKRGCRRFPDQRTLTRFLEGLYGASFGAGVSKMGERQVASFRLEVLAEKYTRRSEKITERGLELLRDVLFDPALERRTIPESVFRQEVENLRRHLRARVNDKAQYAAERLVEEMCQGEPYAVYEYGRLEDLDGIGAEETTETWRRFVRTAPLAIFAVGDFDPARAAERIARLFEAPLAESAGERGEVRPPIVRVRPRRARCVMEEDDVTQGKLVMGYRTDVTVHDRRYFALVFANVILGGGPQGKLFRNVREKAQLAYYAHSGFDRVKGILSVHCGIAFDDFDKAVRIVKKQVADVRAGRFTADEMRDARLAIERSVRSADDAPGHKVNACQEGIVAGRVFSAREILSRVRRLTTKDVAAAAASLELDTVYFLRAPVGAAAGRAAARPNAFE
jgi:predicted Zn-dependent peptidase